MNDLKANFEFGWILRLTQSPIINIMLNRIVRSNLMNIF